MTIDPSKLQSIQEYSRQGNYGFRRLEPEDSDPESFICGLCQEVSVKDEGEYCPECLQTEAEYKEER